MCSKIKFTVIASSIPVVWCLYNIFIGHYDIALHCIFSALCIIVFAVVHKKYPILSNKVYCASLIFLLLSLFAGKSLNLYLIIPQWDKLLHFISGFILVFIGRDIYIKLNGSYANYKLLRIFAFFFAVAAAGMWEIYEFSVDSLFNMYTQNGSLTDTMLDIILGSVSAAAGIFMLRK